MPSSAVCCEDGTAASGSSYCTTAAGNGCYSNSGRSCQNGDTAGGKAAYCCASNTDSFGTFDCGQGMHHCGLNCQPLGTPCCAANATDAECPTSNSPYPEAVT